MTENKKNSALEWVWVETTEHLNTLVDKWMQSNWLAFDTEFMRTDTFYPKVGLMQVSDQNGCYLIDPLAIEDLSSLAQLIAAPSPLKVLHSMSEDVEVFRCALGVSPGSIFDTQIAGAILGMGHAIGYQSLVNIEMGILLDKEETRSDWLQRPLTTRQQEYAARDVWYLAKIYPKLIERLTHQNLYDAVLEESAQFVKQSDSGDEELERYYLKFRGAWRYNIPKQRILQVLASWRERNAREHNVPRGQILTDAAILCIADRQPQNIHVLRQIKDISPRIMNRFGDTIMSLISGVAVQHAPGAHWERIPRPLSGRALDLYRELKEFCVKIAEKEGIAPELLARKKLLEQVAAMAMQPGPLKYPESFCEWRLKVLGSGFEKLIIDFRSKYESNNLLNL